MYVAFKKTQTCFLERLIKFFTGSDYVHCEVVTKKTHDSFYGYTSLPGTGVCRRWVPYNLDDWEFVKVDPPNSIKEFFNKTKDKKYDYLGSIGIILGCRQNPNRYFCSEWCSEFLGLTNPSKITPCELYKVLNKEKRQ